MSHLKYFTVFILILSFGVLAAQSEIDQQIQDQNLHLIGKYQDGKVILRWAPTSTQLWEEANQSGYIVERLYVPLDEDERSRQTFKPLRPEAIRPAPAEDWEALTGTDDAAAAAFMTLYGEIPMPNVPDMISQIKMQNELRNNRYFFAMSAAQLSSLAADLLGLRLEDTDVQAGERYLYKVYAASPLSEGQLDTAFLYLVAEESRLLSPIGLETESGEKQVHISLNTIINESHFHAYYLERAEQPDGPFIRLNEMPMIYLENPNVPGEEGRDGRLHYIDSVGVNYKPYYYRMIGIDYFADLSQPSEVVMGMGKDITPPLPPTIKLAEARDGRSFIQWEKSTLEPDFHGYIVSRGEDPDGLFIPLHEGLLHQNQTEFYDDEPFPGGRNFYTVTAVDTAGNMASSFSAYVFFEDLTLPATPTGLNGSIDSSGVVTLHWTPNPEANILGYRVYWANDIDHRFIMISTEMIMDTTFVDTVSINTLSPQVFYRIAAVNIKYGHSEFSEVLTLERPDIIPPSSGVFQSYLLRDNGVELNWAPSSSADLAGQHLLRRSPGQEWQLLRSLEPNVDTYFDALPEGGTFEYALRGIDNAGLQSAPSFPIGVWVEPSRTIPPVEDLSWSIDENRRSISLSWRYPQIDNHRFIIYRGVNDRGLMTYESVAEADSFTDWSLPENGQYIYAVRAVQINTGKESDLRISDAITLE